MGQQRCTVCQTWNDQDQQRCRGCGEPFSARALVVSPPRSLGEKVLRLPATPAARAVGASLLGLAARIALRMVRNRLQQGRWLPRRAPEQAPQRSEPSAATRVVGQRITEVWQGGWLQQRTIERIVLQQGPERE